MSLSMSIGHTATETRAPFGLARGKSKGTTGYISNVARSGRSCTAGIVRRPRLEPADSSVHSHWIKIISELESINRASARSAA